MNLSFNWRYYTSKYPDLHHLNTEQKALKHWKRHGRGEGRLGCSPEDYIDISSQIKYRYIIINNEKLIIDNLHLLYRHKTPNTIVNCGLIYQSYLILDNNTIKSISKKKFKRLRECINIRNVIMDDKVLTQPILSQPNLLLKKSIPPFVVGERITWICANYNNEKYLVDCIDSLKRQQGNWECIITDDCSTDNSYNIIKKYIQSDNRFTLRQNEQNFGYVRTIKDMTNLSKSDIVSIIDPDDILGDNATEEIYKAYSQLNSGCILTNFNEFKNSDERTLGIKRTHRMTYLKDYYFKINNILLNHPFQHLRTFRKSVAEGSDIFNYLEFPYTEDKDFFFKMDEICDIHFINKPLVSKRIHSEVYLVVMKQ